jgi:Ca-activated chloride channel family protein
MPKSLHARADRKLIRSQGGSRRHLRVEVVAPRRPPRVPVNLALVLDRSGSMHGDKLELAREGAIRAVHSLGDEDRLSVVIYNQRVVVLVPSRVADTEAKEQAEQVLRRIGAKGQTALCDGWLRGCEQVSQELDAHRLGRCLLLTDGLANRGITDRDTIVRSVAEQRRRGVTTSTLGVGRDFDENLLRQMAEVGDGNFYFAEHAVQLSDFIAGETGEALSVATREAALAIELPEGASVTSPNPFPTRSEAGGTVFELGSLVADQVLSLMLCVELPPGAVGDTARVGFQLSDASGTFQGASAEQVFTYASPEEDDSQPRDRDVDREVASAYAARARRRAAERGREGQAEEGRAVLRATASRIRGYAGDEPDLLALAFSLEEEAAGLEEMDNLDYKRLEYSTFRGLRSRGEDGMTIGTGQFLSARTLRVLSSLEGLEGVKAPLFVVAVTTDEEGTRLVETAGRALSAVGSDTFAFTVVDGGARILDPGPDAILSRDEELGLTYALGASEDVVKIAFVRGTLKDGSLSHWHPAERVAIVSLGAWDPSSGVPTEAFVAYQMVLQGTRHGRPDWDPTAATHREVRECWGDQGEAQLEIEAKIDRADLCAECRLLYDAMDVDVEQLLRLVGVVRELAQPLTS